MRKKILVVDDHADLRQLVVLTLDDPNHEITQAGNADIAFDMIKDPPDLLVLDIMMPGKLSGLELCEQIKNNPELDSIKVILLTARGQHSDILEGTKVKSDAYLVKPFSPMVLLQKAHELLKEAPVEIK